MRRDLPNAFRLHLAQAMLCADAALLVSCPLIDKGLYVGQNLLIVLSCRQRTLILNLMMHVVALHTLQSNALS